MSVVKVCYLAHMVMHASFSHHLQSEEGHIEGSLP